MGFFDDLFSGNVGAVAGDIGSFLSNPINDLALAGSIALPFAAPELLGGAAAGATGGALLGGEAATDVGLAGSALAGADVGATAAGTDISALLSGAGAGGAGVLGDVTIPENATFTAGGPVPGVNAPAATPTGGINLSDQLTAGAGGELTGAELGPTGDAGGSLFDRLVGGATGQITRNPLGTAAAGVGLVGSLLQGTKSSGPAESALKAEAPVLQGQGNTLQSYLSTGTLPPALQAQLDQQIQAAKARIIQNHATQGRSTDPSQNSALAQELNNVDLQATALKADTETKLYQQGLEDIQLSAKLNETLANFDRQDQKAVTDALTNFAKAMSPSPQINLNSLLPRQA